MMVKINIYFPMYTTRNTEPNTSHIDLLHCVDEDSNGHFVYKGLWEVNGDQQSLMIQNYLNLKILIQK